MADLRRALAAALRAAEAPVMPGIEPSRLTIYRELIHGNLDGLLRRGFPVLHRITPASRWRDWVAAFLTEHSARTPYFLEIGREFVDWVSRRTPVADDPPFLAELAHYEWVEAALAVADVELPPHDSADLLSRVMDQPLTLSPLAWPLTYRWAVHCIGLDAIPTAPSAAATELLAYRDWEDRVRFMVLNAQTAALLRLLAESPNTAGAALLAHFAALEGVADPAAIMGFGGQLLVQLIEADVVLTTPVDGARCRWRAPDARPPVPASPAPSA